MKSFKRFIAESVGETKGWVNPKTKKAYYTEQMRPYHVEFIVRKPRDYGVTKKQILDYLEKKYDLMDALDPPTEAKRAYDDMLSGRIDIDRNIEVMAMKKGWYRVVGGMYGSIGGLRKPNDRELSVILNIMEDEGIIGFGGAGTKEIGVETYEPSDREDVNPRIRYADGLSRTMTANLLRGRKRGDKQTEIGRTMAMFREDKRVPKTRKNQDPDTHSDLYTDEDPRGTIHGLGFKDVETAEASVRKIESSDRSHAHKIQAAIAMEQRAKVMKKNAEAAVYRRYIEKMKKKTEKMNENVGYFLPGQATTSHGGKSGRGGKPGPRMTKQRRHREEVLMHLITNGIKVTNQPEMVTQKGSSDTFAVPQNQVKKAKKILDDFFKRAYIKKSGMRRDIYTVVAEGMELDEAFNLRSLVKNNAIVKAVQANRNKPQEALMLALLNIPVFAAMIKPDNLTKANIIGTQLKSMILGEDRSK